VYGNHPNIDASALDEEGNTEYTQNANSHRSTDFRDVYGTILKHWVNLPPATVQGLLPLDSTPEAIRIPRTTGARRTSISASWSERGRRGVIPR
jgi:hypothetical protein